MSAKKLGASRSSREGAKAGEVQSSSWTRARMSLKVGACFGHQRTRSGKSACAARSCRADAAGPAHS